MAKVFIFQPDEELPPFHQITLISVQFHYSAGYLAGNTDHNLGLNRSVAVDLGSEAAFLNTHDIYLCWG